VDAKQESPSGGLYIEPQRGGGSSDPSDPYRVTGVGLQRTLHAPSEYVAGTAPRVGLPMRHETSAAWGAQWWGRRDTCPWFLRSAIAAPPVSGQLLSDNRHRLLSPPCSRSVRATVQPMIPNAFILLSCPAARTAPLRPWLTRNDGRGPRACAKTQANCRDAASVVSGHTRAVSVRRPYNPSRAAHLTRTARGWCTHFSTRQQ
jgi:hypothetical protein